MKIIQVYGTGCPKCKQLAQKAEEAAQALGIEYELVKVTSIQHITAAGVMMTPALGVNGVIKVSGKIPSMDEMKALLA